MYRVLVAEDMEAMRLQLSRLATWGEDSGFKIGAMVKDGQEALDLLTQGSWDLLISDIRMPKVDGLELLRESRKIDPQLLVVFLSDHAEFAIAKEAIQYGVQGYLVKPICENELAEVLRNAKTILDKRVIDAKERFEIEQQVKVYPTERIQRIVQLLSLGDETAIELIGSVKFYLQEIQVGNPTKGKILLDQGAMDIRNQIILNHPWLKEYMLLPESMELEELGISIYRNMAIFFPGGAKNPYVKQACQYVLSNIEKELSMEGMATALYISKNYLGEVFKENTGITLGEYVTQIKIIRAKFLLKDKELKGYEIADRLGYNNMEYFTKVFKKHTGITPQEFRKDALKNNHREN